MHARGCRQNRCRTRQPQGGLVHARAAARHAHGTVRGSGWASGVDNLQSRPPEPPGAEYSASTVQLAGQTTSGFELG